MMAATYTGKILGALRTSGKRLIPQLPCTYYDRNSSLRASRIKPKSLASKVRLARRDDLPIVAAMTADDPNFARQDYLITSFDKYLEDPYMRCLIHELDDRPTTFGFAYCGVDDGKTIVMGGIRTFVEHRSKGHAVSLMTATNEIYPNCDFVATSLKKVVKDHCVTESIEYRNEYPFSATEAGMNQKASATRVSPEDNSTVEPLTVSGFCELFNNNELNGYLYPNGRFVMDILIAQPLPTNEKLVQHRKDCIAIFISRSLQETNQQPIVTSSEKSGSFRCFQGMVSYNTWFPCPAGFISKIELYGHVDSCEDIKAHLKAHAQCFRDKRLWGEVIITVDRDRLSVDEVEFKRICQEVGFTAHDYPGPTRHLLFLETENAS